MWGFEAAPAVPYVIAPGLTRASAIRSFIEFTGSEGCATRTDATEQRSETAAKSLIGSGALSYTNWLVANGSVLTSSVYPSGAAFFAISVR